MTTRHTSHFNGEPYGDGTGHILHPYGLNFLSHPGEIPRGLRKGNINNHDGKMEETRQRKQRAVDISYRTRDQRLPGCNLTVSLHIFSMSEANSIKTFH